MNLNNILDGFEISRMNYEESLAKWHKRDYVEIKRNKQISGSLVNSYGQDYYKKNDRWANEYDRCTMCMDNIKPHKGLGLCTECYNKKYYYDNCY